MESRSIKSRHQFHSRRLAVYPDVFGAEHCFLFDGATVRIILPSKLGGDPSRGVARVMSMNATDNQPLWYLIEKIQVEVSKKTLISMHPDSLTQPPNVFERYSEEQRQNHDKIAADHAAIADKAFAYWIRVIRWVCDDHRIGRDEIAGFHTGWSTHLVDIETGKDVWIEPSGWGFAGCRIVSMDEWQTAQVRLSSKSQPPIFFEFYYDAKEFFDLGDFRRAVLESAIACETYLRTVVDRNLPKELLPEMRKFVERAVIHQYRNRFFPEMLEESSRHQFEKVKKTLESLFTSRNKLVHSGGTDGIDQKTCEKYLAAAHALFSIKVIE